MRQICHRLAGAGISVLGSAPASTFKSVIGPVGDAFTYYERVADLDGFLSNFDIVVIPDDAGSGQKNRTLDAIRLGKCVVGRPAAFLGLPPADPPYYVTVSSSDEVAPCLQNLLVSGAFSNIGKIARKEFDARFSWEAFRKRWWHLLEGMSTLKMRTGAE
jgi:hypothetical protein